MSRTYVHMPYWVKTLSPHWRNYFREAHRHDGGPCDIDRFDPAAPWSATRCHIDLVSAGRNICCGCHMCTGHHGRRAAHRAERVRWRATARRAVKTVPGDDPDWLAAAERPRRLV
jgi:hypothetical protein